MSLLPRRTKTDKKVKTPGDGDDHSMHRSYSLNRGLVFVNNQLRTVQRGLEFDFGRTTIGELVDQADGLQFRQYEIRCQLKIHRIEKNIEVLQAFEIVTNLATTIVSAVQLLAPAGPVLASINQLLGYAKSVQLNKREALSVTDKAVSMTLGMQQTIKHVNFKIPPVMITCIHDFYRALDECAVDVCTAAEQSTLPRELLAKIHGESFKAILEDGKEAMEDAYKRFIADCQVIAIAGIYHPNNPATIDEDQQDRKADEEAMCQDLKRLLALGVDGFIDAVKIAGLAPIQREGIKRAIIIAEKLEQAKTQALSTSASTSTPTVTTAAIGASNTTSSMNTPVDPAPVPKPVDLTNSRPPSPQPPVTVFMLLYMVNTPSVTEALALPQTPIPNTRATPDGYSSKPQQSNELVSLRSDFLKRTLEALEAIDADPSPPSPPRRTLMKLTSHEPQTNTFLARVDSSAIPEARWHGKNVRVKSISRVPDDMMGSPKRRRRWRQAYLDQVNLWRNLKPSPFVLHLLGASFVDSSRPWHFLSPFMSNGDIVSYLASPAGAAADRLSLVWQMAQGLRHLHAQQIVHGDFRPKNVLINDQGQAVLSEFGFFFDMKLQVAYDFRGQPETALLSPELLHAIDMREGAIVRFGDVTMASDVFAFGKTSLYVLGNIMPMTFTPKLPFDLDLRPLLLEILLRAYRNHPVKRPTMARLCNMLEKQRFTSEKLRPELDFTSLEICIWGYNMWIDATKAASHPSPFESLSLPSQPPPRPAREDSVETDQYTDASQEIYDVLDISMVPDQLQDIVLSSSFNQGAVFPLASIETL
ncbi:TKL/TKL-CCIN protein kinase [Kwoniella heveanensis CBS 569]|nr:TKL/TKL-CCIN protein kinase [Kwoniella heveanensis CBS 569]